MNKEHVLATLRHHEADLKAKGVLHAGLFGSLARGEAGPESDIDILVELQPNLRIGLWDYVAITQYIEEMFPVKVDVANRAGLKPYVRPNVERDTLYAF